MRISTPLLLILSTMMGIEYATAKEADMRRSYGSTVSDPGLFHYAKMKDALSYGNVQLASDHAHARTQFLALTFRPFNRGQSGYLLKLPGTVELRVDPSPEPIRLDDKLVKRKVEAKTITLPLNNDFSEEVRKMLRENEDTFQSLMPPPE